MEDPIWRTKMQKMFYWDEIWYSEVFDVTNYESELNIEKLKRAYWIWLTEIR